MLAFDQSRANETCTLLEQVQRLPSPRVEFSVNDFSRSLNSAIISRKVTFLCDKSKGLEQNYARSGVMINTRRCDDTFDKSVS